MKRFRNLLAVAIAATMLTACEDDEKTVHYNSVAVTDSYPASLQDVTPKSGSITFTELNTAESTTVTLPAAVPFSLADGVYDAEANLEVECKVATAEGESTVIRSLRATLSSLSVTADTDVTLEWFLYNPSNSLVFSEIFCTGSLNATGTNGLRDVYFRIYNNTDHVIYADGLGIAESAFVNARTNTYEILTAANDRSVNFTAGTIWVIPGSGTDVPVNPGESIKIVDQAIDWNAQVAGALDHTDADFEWWDDHAQDTDNPDVPNLDKWFCYSATIWVVSNQANRSYALVRFPEGTTAESYLAAYNGAYEYIGSTGKQMKNEKAYLIPNGWIIDGVNLSNKEAWVYGALGDAVDMSYASSSDTNRDPNRYGRKFSRKVSAVTADGRRILMDTDNSAADFEFIPVK